MPVPTITAVEPTLQLLTQHVAYSLQLAASESPTSWAATGLPAGLSISSGGLISGTPTTGDAIATASITATNGSGTSAALALYFAVADGVAGGDDADELARFVDWDLDTGYLTFAGSGTAEPANHPPVLAETRPAAAFPLGDRFPLSIGLSRGGTLRSVTGIEMLQVWLSDESRESRYELTVDNEDITLTGTGSASTTRREVMAYLNRDTLLPWLNELADSRAQREAGFGVPPQTYGGALLQITAEIPEDAREFSATATQAITSLVASETENHTFSVSLSEQITSAVNYEIVAELLAPSNANYAASLTIMVAVTWGGSAFSVAIVDDTLPKSVAKDGSTADNYDLTFSIQSVTGDSAGFDVAVRAVTTAEVLDDPYTFAIDASNSGDYDLTGGEVSMLIAGPHWEFYNSSDVLIGSLGIAENPTTDSMSDLRTKIETATGETLVNDPAITGTDIQVVFPNGTAVAYIRDLTPSPSNVDYTGAGNTPMNITNASFKITVTGQAMAGTGQRLSSLPTPIRLLDSIRDFS